MVHKKLTAFQKRKSEGFHSKKSKELSKKHVLITVVISTES